jgi:flagellin
MGIGTLSGATATLPAIEAALEEINGQRATIGAAVNRLAYAADNLTNIASNATQSRSTIMDTDYALATTQLAKTQIIQQAATAMLAQANQQPQQVMALLKG